MPTAILRDLDLRTLRLFVAVCDLRNMARAAESEHIEPSAVSKRITQLEAALGTRLLVRGRRGVEPTAAGESVLAQARNVLFSAQQTANAAAGFEVGVTGHVRLAATASAIAESLLDDIAAFMREPQNRGIRVDVEERYSRDLVRALRDGEASIGVAWDTIDLRGLASRPYRRDRLAVAVHASHPLARRASLRFDETLDHEHVGLPPATAVHTMLMRAAARLGRSVNYRVVVSNFDAAFRVVSANLAISVVPIEIGTRYASASNVKLIALSDPWAHRRFSIAFQDGDRLPPAALRLVEHLVLRASSGEPHGIDDGRDAPPPSIEATPSGRPGRRTGAPVRRPKE